MSELTEAVEAAVADARSSYVLNAKLQPFVFQGTHYCPNCFAYDGEKCRLVFGMRSDGSFPKNTPQKRKRFTLVRPVIATKACKCATCGYWWPAFSFTPQTPQVMTT